MKKNYQILLGNIVSRLSNSEKHFLFEVVKEEVKRLRKEDIILRGQSRPRPLHWVNRDFYDLSTENLRGLDVIKENLALESPLQALNYLINNISDDVDTVLAIRFLVKCFDSKTGEADLIVEKIDYMLFKIADNSFYTAPKLALLIEINYQSSSGLKYFKEYKLYVLELKRIFRNYNFRTPIEDVKLINKQLLRIVNSEIIKSTRENLENKILLEELKIEIKNSLT